MEIEFTHRGKTYQCQIPCFAIQPLTVGPPAIIRVPYRPCPLKPTVFLELSFVGTDDIRHLELYKPIREVPS